MSNPHCGCTPASPKISAGHDFQCAHLNKFKNMLSRTTPLEQVDHIQHPTTVTLKTFRWLSITCEIKSTISVCFPLYTTSSRHRDYVTALEPISVPYFACNCKSSSCCMRYVLLIPSLGIPQCHLSFKFQDKAHFLYETPMLPRK